MAVSLSHQLEFDLPTRNARDAWTGSLILQATALQFAICVAVLVTVTLQIAVIHH
jgi:hypothetical protein